MNSFQKLMVVILASHVITATASSSQFLCDSDTECTQSRSIIIPRSITYDSTYELSLANYAIYHHDDEYCFRLFKTPFYQQSNDSKHNLKRYFLPNRDYALAIQEDGSGNIGSPWLGLFSGDKDFSSVVTISPKRQVLGVHFNAHLDLSNWWYNSWFALATAPLLARNSLNMCIEQCTPAVCCDFVDSTESALNNPKLNHGKLQDKGNWHFGIDDVQIKMGKDHFFCHDQHHVGFYGVLGIPTGSDPSSTYLFSTNVGSSHGRLGVGLNADFGFYACNDLCINLMVDFKYFYIFGSTEKRSFDLCYNGDWSRYLHIVFEGQPLNSKPAINYLTLPVRVTPRNEIQLWIAPHAHWCNWEFEIGYNLWWRDSEKISFDCCLNKIGIFDLSGICGTHPTSASAANISQTVKGYGDNAVLSDEQFTPLKTSDLNIDSGRQATALTHKLYGALERNFCLCERNFELGLGGSYEFARRCEYPLENWAIFLKMGHAF